MSTQNYLEVSKGVKIYFQKSGEGFPVIFLHGGPGADCLGYKDVNADLFSKNQGSFELIEFDQRGTGKSEPSIQKNFSEENRRKFQDLHIDDTVSDIEKLRKHLNIESWLVFGGSWGSTVALRYAHQHPSSVSGLIIRGIFLANTYEMDDYFTMDGRRSSPHGIEQLQKLFSHLSSRELQHSAREVIEDLGKKIIAGDESTAIQWALDEKNYMLGTDKTIKDIAKNEKKNYLCEAYHQAVLFKNIIYGTSSFDLISDSKNMGGFPIWIVQGASDNICPSKYADQLVATLKENSLKLMKYHKMEQAGHQSSDKSVKQALKDSLKEFFTMFVESKKN